MRERWKRAEKVERNRNALLIAARRVFLDRGYTAATLEAIAEEAGFSKGLVYSQFDSKADLFLALLDERIAERAAQNRRVAEGLAGAEGFIALFKDYDREASANAGWVRLLVEFRAHAARDPALNARYARAHARAIEQLAAVLGGLHERAGRQPALPLYHMTEWIFAIGVGIALERAANPDALPAPEIIPAIIRSLGLSGG